MLFHFQEIKDVKKILCITDDIWDDWMDLALVRIL